MPKVKILSDRPLMLSGDFRSKNEIVDVTEAELTDLIDLDQKAGRDPRVEVIKKVVRKKSAAPSFDSTEAQDEDS